MKRNHLIAEYNKAVKEELKYGCAFAAVSGEEDDARVRFYSPHCAAASWNAKEGRMLHGVRNMSIFIRIQISGNWIERAEHGMRHGIHMISENHSWLR